MNQQQEEKLIELVQDEIYHLRAAKEARDQKNEILQQYAGRSYKIGLIDTTPKPEGEKSPLKLVEKEVKPV